MPRPLCSPLYAAWIEFCEPPGPSIERLSDEDFRVADVRFTVSWHPGSTPDHFHIRKSIPQAEAVAALLAGYSGGNIVELGIAQGGSTALAALVARPRRLVSIEYDAEPLVALTAFVADGWEDRVRPYFGVDQADRATVAQIVLDEFGDQPLDLVIDDASHLRDETIAAFETLFPHLRPGGEYVIEDWSWRQQTANNFHDVLTGPPSDERAALERAMASAVGRVRADPSHPRFEEANALDGGEIYDAEPAPPVSPAEQRVEEDPGLLKLVFELILVHIAHRQIVSEVVIVGDLARIRRGPAPIDPDTFHLGSLFHDHDGILT